MDNPELIKWPEIMKQGSSATLAVEFTEIGSSVPFKVIKLEPCDETVEMGVPDPLLSEVLDPIKIEVPEQSVQMYSTQACPGPSNIDHPGPSKLPSYDASSPSLNKRQKTESELSFVQNNTAISEEDACSGGSDMDFHNNSETDLEYEYLSESDDLNDPGHDDGTDKLDDDSDDSATNNGTKIKALPRDNPPTLEWSSDSTTIKKLAFNMKQQLLIPPPQDPYQAFRLFFDDKLLDMIVQETNNYATHACSNPSLGPKSRFKAWRALTRDELVTFLGLLIHTGTIRMHLLGDYWKGDYLFNLTCFSKFMPRNRFMLILNCLSFTPHEATSGTDSFSKFRPIMDSFNKKMNEMYYPGKALYLANSLQSFWQSQLECENKISHYTCRHKVDFSTLAEPNGIVIKYLINSGNSRNGSTKMSRAQVIMELLKEKLGKGHAVYMDEHFSSYRVALKLLNQKTYSTGLFDKHRIDNPFKRKTYKLKKSDNKSLFLDGVHIGKYKDKSCTYYITTEFNNELVTVIDRTGVMNLIPKTLDQYNRFMTSSELHNQLMTYYPVEMKTIRCYRKLFIHSLQICLNNAFLLYNNFSGQKKWQSYDFRLFILRQMLPEPLIAPPNTIQGKHALSKITKTRSRLKSDRGYGQRIITEVIRKECRVCKQKKKRTATSYECLGCEGTPGYCTSCFCEIHSYRP